MTSLMKARLFGMKLIYLMLFGDQRVQGLFLWNTIHLRYFVLQALNLTSFLSYFQAQLIGLYSEDESWCLYLFSPHKLPINMKAYSLSGIEAQWHSLCPHFLCTIWISTRSQWSWVPASCCLWKNTSYDSFHAHHVHLFFLHLITYWLIQIQC